jgi:hypothetical protein
MTARIALKHDHTVTNRETASFFNLDDCPDTLVAEMPRIVVPLETVFFEDCSLIADCGDGDLDERIPGGDVGVRAVHHVSATRFRNCENGVVSGVVHLPPTII